MKKEKGALAIEATISFTVFITFLFMLMAIVKLSMVYITINDITAETTKRIAGMSYPLSFVNEYMDSKLEKLPDPGDINLIDEAKKGNALSLLDVVFENFDSVEDIVTNLKSSLIETIVETLVEVKQQAITGIMAKIYMGMVDDSHMPIDKSKIDVVYFTVPIGDYEFEHSKDDISVKTGIPVENLSNDDVILLVNYDYSIIVPFFPKYDVTLRSLAVEKAWLNGGDQSLNADVEGIDLDLKPAKKRVLIAPDYGKKYHNVDGCQSLSNSANIKIVTMEEASKGVTSEGEKLKHKYTACALCSPGK